MRPSSSDVVLGKPKLLFRELDHTHSTKVFNAVSWPLFFFLFLPSLFRKLHLEEHGFRGERW